MGNGRADGFVGGGADSGSGARGKSVSGRRLYKFSGDDGAAPGQRVAAGLGGEHPAARQRGRLPGVAIATGRRRKHLAQRQGGALPGIGVTAGLCGQGAVGDGGALGDFGGAAGQCVASGLCGDRPASANVTDCPV